jgi:hypothetical protein
LAHGGKHHEIYLSDPRKGDPEQMKTVRGIRWPGSDRMFETHESRLADYFLLNSNPWSNNRTLLDLVGLNEGRSSGSVLRCRMLAHPLVSDI